MLVQRMPLVGRLSKGDLGAQSRCLPRAFLNPSQIAELAAEFPLTPTLSLWERANCTSGRLVECVNYWPVTLWADLFDCRVEDALEFFVPRILSIALVNEQGVVEAIAALNGDSGSTR